jgi:hypothetical protein
MALKTQKFISINPKMHDPSSFLPRVSSPFIKHHVCVKHIKVEVFAQSGRLQSMIPGQNQVRK